MQIAGNWRRRALLAALLALAAALTLLLVRSAKHTTGTTSAADHLPADKMTVSAATTNISAPGADVTLLSGTLRTSTPADLLISATAECSIVTNVTTTGTDDQKAEGVVNMWIVIDSTRVVPQRCWPKGPMG